MRAFLYVAAKGLDEPDNQDGSNYNVNDPAQRYVHWYQTVYNV